MDEQEFELRQTELILREREVIAREREVSAKEQEPRPSRWTNPLIISLLVGALALGGNIWTNISNNKASAEAEHFRAQSNLVLSVIKTNGNDEDACKNLNFFVNIGWLEDGKGAIHNVCGTKGGVPSLPASSTGALESGGYGSGGFTAGGYGVGLPWIGSIPLTVRVDDADSHVPIANAKVDLETIKFNPVASIVAEQNTFGTSSTAVYHFTTDEVGDAALNVSSSDNLIVSKDGYEGVTKRISEFGLSPQNGGIVIIDLRRVSKPKH
jgi:hypothetical protein